LTQNNNKAVQQASNLSMAVTAHAAYFSDYHHKLHFQFWYTMIYTSHMNYTCATFDTVDLPTPYVCNACPQSPFCSQRRLSDKAFD